MSRFVIQPSLMVDHWPQIARRSSTALPEPRTYARVGGRLPAPGGDAPAGSLGGGAEAARRRARHTAPVTGDGHTEVGDEVTAERRGLVVAAAFPGRSPLGPRAQG
ncbi:hypothetical protein GCM10010177_40050 [Actinomadura citrea]|nr:hypothetical protein GCM10010177_40050 [Actinomadura citrea]